MNKQLQTYYLPVSVDKNAPTLHQYYLDKYEPKAARWVPQGYLSEQQGVILSAEEWEKVQKCIELLLKVIDGCKARVWLGSALTEAENILSQLNKDI